jgi:hypothetical protein
VDDEETKVEHESEDEERTSENQRRTLENQVKALQDEKRALQNKVRALQAENKLSKMMFEEKRLERQRQARAEAYSNEHTLHPETFTPLLLFLDIFNCG